MKLVGVGQQGTANCQCCILCKVHAAASCLTVCRMYWSLEEGMSVSLAGVELGRGWGQGREGDNNWGWPGVRSGAGGGG